MNTKWLVYWITERWAIKKKREAGLPKPWTANPILQSVRFCNVDREDDTVTKWIADNWRRDNVPDNWFAMAVARWINHPESLAEIGYPLPWKPMQVEKVLRARAERGEKVWTAAYVIGTQGAPMSKPAYVVNKVLNPLWVLRNELRPRRGDTLAEFSARLTAIKGQGTFMVGQIIADAKHCDPILQKASDWWTFAISGPGSRRGLNRVVGRDVDAPWRETTWANTLADLLIAVKKELPIEIKKVLCAQNLQNCLCEFDKFERVRNNDPMRPRAKYNGI
jgi:hypothetical protein